MLGFSLLLLEGLPKETVEADATFLVASGNGCTPECRIFASTFVNCVKRS